MGKMKVTQILGVVSLILVLGLFTTCNSSKKSATSKFFKIPRKIVKAEDLPEQMQNNDDRSDYSVQLFPDQMEEDKTVAQSEPTAENIIKNELEGTVNSGEKTTPDVVEPIKTPIQERVDDIVEKIVKNKVEPIYYHIVSGSFQNKLYADMFAKSLQDIGYGTTYVQFFNNGFNRVIVKRYRNEVEARGYLQDYRADNPQYATAWLFYKADLENEPLSFFQN